MFKIQGTKNKRVGKLISFLEIQELHNAGGTARSPLLRCLGKDWRGFVPYVKWQWGGAVLSDVLSRTQLEENFLYG